MELQKDFEDFCVSLNGRNVEYVIIGGYALAVHGAPRFTGDPDIFIRPTKDNVNKLLAAVRDFGFREPRLDPNDLLRRRAVFPGTRSVHRQQAGGRARQGPRRHRSTLRTGRH